MPGPDPARQGGPGRNDQLFLGQTMLIFFPNPHGYLYPDFLLDEVMPAVAERYRVEMDREHIAIGGSSYGALAALYAVIHRPGKFGRVLLESTPTFIAEDKIMKEAGRCHEWPGRAYIGIGTKETPDEVLNKAAIPRARQLLELIMNTSPGTRVELVVGEGDSHSARAWSRRLPGALEYLFGPFASPIAK